MADTYVPKRKDWPTWRFCPACKSYRFTWIPRHRLGACQDCRHVVSERSES